MDAETDALEEPELKLRWIRRHGGSMMQLPRHESDIDFAEDLETWIL